MKTLLKYPGAKNRLAPWIVSHIPPHKVYCEPFLGSGATSPNPAKAWAGLPETIQLAAKMLKNAQIEHKDALELIKDLYGKDTFIYIEPPYLQDTRKGYLYNNEMTDEQHVKLLQIVKESDCKIMISAYENELYNTELIGWRKEYKSTTAECSKKRTETLYMNY